MWMNGETLKLIIGYSNSYLKMGENKERQVY